MVHRAKFEWLLIFRIIEDLHFAQHFYDRLFIIIGTNLSVNVLEETK